MKIMYMGTPLFAARVLEIIKEEFENSDIDVVTKVDTPQGRSYKLTPSETKVAAEKLGLPVFQPENLKEENFKEILEASSPDVIIVAAYGKILPEYVLEFPKYGCINVHGSLLPEYRGAAPVNRAIMDGKTKTGVTIMYMEKGLDTGDMLSKAEVDITDDTTATELFATLAEVGGRLMCDTLRSVVKGEITPEKQDSEKSTYAEKLTSDDRIIDWSKPAREIVRKIHGLSDEPSATTHTPDGKLLKIFRASVSDDSPEGEVGEVVSVKKKLQVKAGEGSVLLLEVQGEGAKRMKYADFLNGRRIALGDKLGE